jgi:hypothetical protein
LHHSGGVHEDVDRPVRSARGGGSGACLCWIGEIRDDAKRACSRFRCARVDAIGGRCDRDASAELRE